MALIAHYKFEDDLTDETAGAYDGAAVGEVSYDASGYAGKALKTAVGEIASNHGFSTPTDFEDAISANPSFTFDCYVKPLELNNPYNCIFRDNAGRGNNYVYILKEGGVWGNINTVGGGEFQTAAGLITVGNWHRITVVQDGAANTIKIYIDEVEKANISEVTGDSSFYDDGLIYIGVDDYIAQDLAGLMDEVKWYDSAEPPVAPPVGPAGIKTINDLAIASVKTINDLAIASVKTISGSA